MLSNFSADSTVILIKQVVYTKLLVGFEFPVENVYM